MKRSMIWILAIAVGWTAPLARATEREENKNAHLWNTRVHSLTVFKNGMGFFMRQGEAVLRDGWVVADAVPPAAFGTLAIYSHAENEIVDMIGSGPGELVEFDGMDLPDDLATRRARLEAAKYLKVKIDYRQTGSDRSATGKLMSVGDEFVVLQAEAGNLAAPLAEIKSLQVLEKPLRVHVSSESGNPVEKTTLGMAYLTKGVTWIPEYTLKLLDDETAELTLRGTLVNEAEDLVHCDINFVVGVPHFLHAEYLAPIAAGQAIRAISATVAPFGNMTQQALVFSNSGSPDPATLVQPVPAENRDLSAALGNLPQWEGSGGTDFTVYTRKDLTVRRGEKAIVTLFVKRISYSHIYRWSPPGEIAHYLVLKNNTSTAWTTGPCLAVSGASALSEDLLKYVPVGGSGEFPVTTAINFTRDQQEAEVDRKLKAHEPTHGVFHDLVTINGELSVRNLGKDPARLSIALPITGKPISASNGGNIRVNTGNLKLLERSGTAAWTVELPPGGAEKLQYAYERFVPSQ